MAAMQSLDTYMTTPGGYTTPIVVGWCSITNLGLILFQPGKTFILQGYFPRLPYQPSNVRAVDARVSAIWFFSLL